MLTSKALSIWRACKKENYLIEVLFKYINLPLSSLTEKEYTRLIMAKNKYEKRLDKS